MGGWEVGREAWEGREGGSEGRREGWGGREGREGSEGVRRDGGTEGGERGREGAREGLVAQMKIIYLLKPHTILQLEH